MRAAGLAKRIRRPLGWMTSILLLVTLLAGCGGIVPATEKRDNEAPVLTVKQFIAALRSKDATQMLEHVARDETIGSYVSELQIALNLLQTLNIEDEQYTLLENDGTNAKVKMTAKVAFAIRGVPLLSQQGEVIFSLRRVGDQWLIWNVEPVLPKELGK